jgi:hypothetical protein
MCAYDDDYDFDQYDAYDDFDLSRSFSKSGGSRVRQNHSERRDKSGTTMYSAKHTRLREARANGKQDKNVKCKR